MQPTYSDSTLTIDLAAIAANYALLAQKAGGKAVAAVVKANAYGLGVEPVAKTLAKAGCRYFFVANLDEAIELRGILPDADIAVFQGVMQGQEAVFSEYRLVPVLNSPEQVRHWSVYGQQQKHAVPAILHVDTGMNRLGVSPMQQVDTAGIALQYIMSHLACADETTHPQNAQQLARLLQFCQNFPGIPVTFANSYGIFLGSDYHFDMLRPGMALYGLNPLPASENPMRSVVQLTSKILQIRVIDRPDTVGYGATCTVAAGTKIATVAVGYADGYLRSAGNRGYCAVAGQKVPVVGRVSMDLITLDVSSIDGAVNVGDTVEVIGPTISADDVAGYAGTIGYEILTSLGARYRREYVGG